ncbi:MAG: molybdopterin molybdenumtransferase MoeA, partial [Deltaproteobacteria bacterium]|nr:molybdopterin molybdenumtransferase MoeA [Deltaproteobacteria bacterium]
MNRIEEQPAVSAGEALRRILNAVKTLGTEKISLPQAMGRILGEDIHAPRSIPPLDNSAMDGFALKAADTKGAGPDSHASLKI